MKSEKEPLKLKILNKLGLTTLGDCGFKLAALSERHVRREERADAERNKKIREIENNYKSRLKESDKRIGELMLEIERKKAIVDSKNAEIGLLNNEINMLNKEMKGMVKLTVLRAQKPTKQTMKVKSSTVRSNIARKSASEIDSEE